MAERPSNRADPVVTLDWSTFQLICEQLSEHGGKYKACEALGFNYSTVRDAITSANARDDTEWQTLWDTSFSAFQERLEQELLRRGMEGVSKKVYGRLEGRDAGDGVVGEEVQYSDSLLLAANRAYNERYRERASVVLASGLEVPDVFAALTPAARKAVRDIVINDLAEQAAIHKSPEVIDIANSGTRYLEAPKEPRAKAAARKGRKDRGEAAPDA